MDQFELREPINYMSGALGFLSVVFNFVVGCLLIIRGYQDQGTFKGWG